MKKYDIAAYIYPAYSGKDPRSRVFWPEGYGEWQSVKDAVKKFPEHSWPRKPLWGYVNEADSYIMEMQINAASDYGINTFIYDWYWYDKMPFLEDSLNDGYLKARNNDKVKFYLMWANHVATTVWDIRNSHKIDNLWDGAVTRGEFEMMAGRLIEKYFKHPSYYKINNKPVFMIYNVPNLLRGMGGVKKAAEAFEWLRNQAKTEGLDGIHFQFVMNGSKEIDLSGIESRLSVTRKEVVMELGFDSITHYQFAQFTDMNRDYNEIVADALKEWERIETSFDIPYYPHISLGWDNNPRFKELRNVITTNNTPENIQKALMKAKEYADSHLSQPPLITINSWNEWTETSYLQPDDLYGYAYLEAVKKVFT